MKPLAGLMPMIVSHKHRFIFIKTRKTAGTSLEIALSEYCGDSDIITPIDRDDEAARATLTGRQAQNYKLGLARHLPNEWLGMLLGKPRKSFYNHMPAQEAKALLGDTIWNSYYKFCFERNPFDKVLSQYFARGGDDAFGSVMGYLKSGEVARLRGYDMYSLNHLPAMDHVYKFEEMNESLREISEKLALPKPLKLPEYKAKGGRRGDKRHYREVLTEEEKELISLIFAREIKLLGYSY
ncbi:hypothetical protein GC194_07110 [bacterium]|nr:hypothetical protein [bacterium]